MLQLILGGARSGKSRLAEQTAKESELSVVYIATAQALDEEMQQRIQHHQQQRPSHWQLCEEPIFLADQLLQLDQENQLILVDCLTLWLTNLLLAEDTALQQQQTEYWKVHRDSRAQELAKINYTANVISSVDRVQPDASTAL